MGIITNLLKLFLTNMETDGDELFDFERDLNQNFRKIEARFQPQDIILSPTAWVGSTAPYSQTIELEDMTEEMNPHASLILSEDYETAQFEKKEYSKLFKAESGEGAITFYATSPTGVALNIRIKRL